MVQVQFIPEAAGDYKDLDGSLKVLAAKKIDEMAENPFLGERLGNKFNIDLSGFFKLYFNNKKHRIVYRLLNPGQIEIVEIWGIGKRDKEEIYRIIAKRIQKRK